VVVEEEFVQPRIHTEFVLRISFGAIKLYPLNMHACVYTGVERAKGGVCVEGGWSGAAYQCMCVCVCV
jgi:hypothetical protein